MTAVAIVAAYALQEALRRRVFLVVLVLTAAFLGLFWLGSSKAFDEARDFTGTTDSGVDIDVVVGGTLLGLAMFATLFLGTVLAIFLTLGAVRGDAERGLLQPLVVRPLGRATFLLARFLGAALVCGALRASASTWRPSWIVSGDRRLGARPARPPGARARRRRRSSSARCRCSARSSCRRPRTGSRSSCSTAPGLTGGLLGQIGEGINSETLMRVSERTSWALPFEALYQDGAAPHHRGHGRPDALRRQARPVRRRAGGRAGAGRSGRPRTSD